MASFTPNLGDAVHPDGTLKDASEISWSFDADDTIPFPSSDDTHHHSISSGSPVPATVRRTTRISRPSRRVLEAAESALSAPTSTHSAAKRKAPHASPTRRVTQKVVINVDDEDADNSNASSDDGGSTTEPATEPASDDYEALQAMADADDQVGSLLPFTFRSVCSFISQAVTFKSREQRTADIRLIFRREKGHVHPVTKKVLDGHWCTVCR